MNVHGSFIHNSQKSETAQLSINMRMDKQKKKQTINICNMDEPEA